MAHVDLSCFSEGAKLALGVLVIEYVVFSCWFPV